MGSTERMWYRSLYADGRVLPQKQEEPGRILAKYNHAEYDQMYVPPERRYEIDFSKETTIEDLERIIETANFNDRERSVFRRIINSGEVKSGTFYYKRVIRFR